MLYITYIFVNLQRAYADSGDIKLVKYPQQSCSFLGLFDPDDENASNLQNIADCATSVSTIAVRMSDLTNPEIVIVVILAIIKIYAYITCKYIYNLSA